MNGGKETNRSVRLAVSVRPDEQLHRAACWLLEERTDAAWEALTEAVSRYEAEGNEVAVVLAEAVDSRDGYVAAGRVVLSEWHVRARKALGRG